MGYVIFLASISALAVFLWQRFFAAPATALGSLPLGNIPGANLFSSSNEAAGGESGSGQPGSSFADAIAHAEGFYTTGSIPQRNNNPGDFRSWGGYPAVNGYVQFPTVADGWNALEEELNLIRSGTSHVYKPSMSFRQMAYLYADGANDPQGAANWSKNVADFLGASEDEAIGNYL